MSTLSLQQFVDLQDRDGHEREFMVVFDELADGWEGWVYVRPRRSGYVVYDGWDQYARVS
jgi:hypothetical protein